MSNASIKPWMLATPVPSMHVPPRVAVQACSSTNFSATPISACPCAAAPTTEATQHATGNLNLSLHRCCQASCKVALCNATLLKFCELAALISINVAHLLQSKIVGSCAHTQASGQTLLANPRKIIMSNALQRECSSRDSLDQRPLRCREGGHPINGTYKLGRE